MKILLINEEAEIQRKRLQAKLFNCIEFMHRNQELTDDPTTNFLKTYANIGKLNEIMKLMQMAEYRSDRIVGQIDFSKIEMFVKPQEP